MITLKNFFLKNPERFMHIQKTPFKNPHQVSGRGEPPAKLISKRFFCQVIKPR